MELIIFCGAQGAGKTSFYQNTFAKTHLRISMDMLKTRRRETAILNACLNCGQRCVIDNTNPTVADRARYISAAKAFHFTPIIYFFETPIEQCLIRNNSRTGKERIPERGVHATYLKLEMPMLEEGVASIYIVDAAGQARLEKRV
jgi:predicted kinase